MAISATNVGTFFSSKRTLGATKTGCLHSLWLYEELLSCFAEGNYRNIYYKSVSTKMKYLSRTTDLSTIYQSGQWIFWHIYFFIYEDTDYFDPSLAVWPILYSQSIAFNTNNSLKKLEVSS